MIGSLSKTLMQKAVAFAGDGAKPVSISILTSTDYDTETGEVITTRTEVPIGRALLGRISEADSKKLQLTNTTHKVIIAMNDYTAAGSPELPQSEDDILVGGVLYTVDRVVKGSMDQSLIFYICEK